MSYRYSKTKVDGFIADIWYKECELQTTKSSGPGGQNVNKITATRTGKSVE